MGRNLFSSQVRIEVQDLPVRPVRASVEELEQVFGGSITSVLSPMSITNVLSPGSITNVLSPGSITNVLSTGSITDVL